MSTGVELSGPGEGAGCEYGVELSGLGEGAGCEY